MKVMKYRLPMVDIVRMGPNKPVWINSGGLEAFQAFQLEMDFGDVLQVYTIHKYLSPGCYFVCPSLYGFCTTMIVIRNSSDHIEYAKARWILQYVAKTRYLYICKFKRKHLFSNRFYLGNKNTSLIFDCTYTIFKWNF